MKRNNTTMLALALCAAMGSANAEEGLQQSAQRAAAVDTGSTALGLAAGAVELNPVGPVLTLGGKYLFMKYAETLPDNQRASAYAGASAIWGGAAANNLCVTAAILSGGAFAPACIVVGLAYGAHAWQRSAHERQFWEEGCPMIRQYSGIPDLPCVYTPPPEEERLPVVQYHQQEAP